MKGNTKTQCFRDVAATFREDSDRWIPWAPVCFGLGVACYFYLLEEPRIWFTLIIIFVSTVLFLMVRRTPEYFLLFGVLLFFVLGFGTAQLRTYFAQAPVLQKEIGPTTLEGRISKVERFENGIRLLLTNPRINGLSAFETPERVRIRIRGKAVSAEPGTWVKAKAVLMPPPPPATPGSFDFQRKFYFEKIGAIGYGLGQPLVMKSASELDSSPEILISTFRSIVADRILSQLSGQTGAIAVALITGDRSGLNEQTLESIRRAGLAHLLAISGLHIGLVAGGFFFVIRSLASLVPVLLLNYPIKKWAAIFAIVGAFGYALLAGASIPTQRAFLMTALALVGVLIDRETISLRTLAWVALVVLAFHPEAILGPSFQMSFAAVTALITFYQYWRYKRKERTPDKFYGGFLGRILFYFGGVILTTVIASIATAPFALYHFGQVATFGMLANLFAIPLAAFWVMPWAVLSIVCMPFGIEQLFLTVMGVGIDLIQTIASFFSDLPNAVFSLSVFPTPLLAILVLGGLFFCLGEKNVRKAGAGIVLASIGLIGLSPSPVLLIENAGNHLAFISQDGTQLISKDSYQSRSGKSWLKRAGYIPSEKLDNDNSMRCDRLACVAKYQGKIIAYVFHEAALMEECYLANILVSTIPIRRQCPVPEVIIDRFDLWKYGAYAVYIDSAGVQIETEQGMRGNRPWVRRKAP